MSADFDPDEHLGEIAEAARFALPAFTNNLDFTNIDDARYPGRTNDYDVLAERAWKAGAALVKRYHRAVEEASGRYARRQEALATEKGASHG